MSESKKMTGAEAKAARLAAKAAAKKGARKAAAAKGAGARKGKRGIKASVDRALAAAPGAPGQIARAVSPEYDSEGAKARVKVKRAARIGAAAAHDPAVSGKPPDPAEAKAEAEARSITRAVAKDRAGFCQHCKHPLSDHWRSERGDRRYICMRFACFCPGIAHADYPQPQAAEVEHA